MKKNIDQVSSVIKNLVVFLRPKGTAPSLCPCIDLSNFLDFIETVLPYLLFYMA